MAVARKARLNVLILTLFTSYFISPSFAAVERSDDLDGYIRSTITIHGQFPALELQDIYKAPLVAASWTFKCETGSGSDGYMDAAISDTAPIPTGKQFHVGAQVNECDEGVNAAIFADGKEIGDRAALQLLHQRRIIVLDESTKFIQSGILKMSFERWDPSDTLLLARQRRQSLLAMKINTPEESFDQTARIEYLSRLAVLLQRYDKGNKTMKDKRALLARLTNWQAYLTTPKYLWALR